MSKGVLFIIFSLGKGGTQRNLVNIVNKIEFKHKKKVLFLYNAIKTSDLENQIGRDVKIYKVNSRSKFKNFTRLRVLISIIKKENISSIISFALNGAYLALISKLFFPFRNLPIIYRLVSIPSALMSSKYSIVLKLKNFFFVNVLCRHVNTIICQSNFMYSSLIAKSPKVLAKKSIVIKNLVDFSRINDCLNENFDVNYKFFVYVGRLSAEKNIIQIIKAFNIIKDKTDSKLLIIGNGSEFNKIKNFIKSCNLQDRVLMLGFKKNPYKYLKKSIALILFSKYEGLPNVVLESMYCKTPVIISNFDGSDEIVKHNETGYIVKKNDVKKLAEFMFDISTKLAKGKLLTNNAHKFILKLNASSIKSYKKIIY